MKSARSYLKTIEKLRLKHTNLFNSSDKNKWLKMQTINGKIRENWAAYHKINDKNVDNGGNKRHN